MAETTTETPTIQSEGATSTEAAAATLLTSTETAATTTQPGETQTTQPEAEGEKTAEEKTAETKLEGAPETYEFKAPEGASYDAAVLEPFSAAAKKANLTQDAAQMLLDDMAPVIAARQQAQVDEIRTGWLTATKTDKEFGGEQLPQNMAVAKKALDQFDPLPSGATSTPLRRLLEDTGFGNHPDVIRLLYRAGKALSEDKFVAGSPAPVGEADRAKRLYGNQITKE